MDKFLFSALLNEVYKEILFITYNYQKERIDEKDIKKLDATDYNNLRNSKNLYRYFDLLCSIDLKDTKFFFDISFLNMLEKREYNYDTLKKSIDFLNPYIDYYNSEYKKLVDSISVVLDVKMKEKEYIGEFPLYIKITSDNCLIERAVVTLNAPAILNKQTNKLTYKLTYMDYDIKLDNYCFKNNDLRNLDKKEIINLLDKYIKISLSSCKYYETKPVIVRMENDSFIAPSVGEQSVWLDKRVETFTGFKESIKGAIKRVIFSIIIIVSATIILYLLNLI